MVQDTASRRDFLRITTSIGLAAGAAAPAAAQDRALQKGSATPVACALEPRQNALRNVLDLSGLWDFALDPDGTGEGQGWATRLPASRLIAVPGSWNEQFQDTRDYTGVGWYQTRVSLPRVWQGQRIVLRFGSAVYQATVWVDGRWVGEHLGGHLPFAFEITGLADWDRPMTLTARVENIGAPTRVPPSGNSVPGHAANSPDVNYDYFPYSGLHRSVTLYTFRARTSPTSPRRPPSMARTGCCICG